MFLMKDTRSSTGKREMCWKDPSGVENYLTFENGADGNIESNPLSEGTV